MILHMLFSTTKINWKVYLSIEKCFKNILSVKPKGKIKYHVSFVYITIFGFKMVQYSGANTFLTLHYFQITHG